MSLDPDAIPRVTGRHRNRPLAAVRRRRAFELIAQGRTYRQVAAELGYSNPGTVHKIVAKAMSEYEIEDVEFRLAVEIARLNRLQLSLWPKAEAGDVTAVKAIRDIILTRVKLLKLDETDAPSRPRTVVNPDAVGNEGSQRLTASEAESFIRG